MGRSEWREDMNGFVPWEDPLGSCVGSNASSREAPTLLVADEAKGRVESEIFGDFSDSRILGVREREKQCLGWIFQQLREEKTSEAKNQTGK